MMDALHFIFSSFWVWSGTVILVFTAGVSIGIVIESVRK